jgi:nicotinate-nucleotide adenylyltransferase
MLRLAIKGFSIAEISEIELEREGKSYTDDTLKELMLLYPSADLWLFMGGDMLETFEMWRNFEWLIKNVSICALSRHESRDRLEAAAEELRKKYGASVILAANDAIEISSSELRAALKKRGGVEYLNGEVYAYIIKNRLYGSKANYDWLREKAKQMLDPKRVSHVLGCEKEAVSLAERWGADIDDSRSAAILHDITKKLSLSEQLILCEKYGIIIDTVERQEAKLLHSITGAALAEYEFGMPKEVCSAIRWHTTGRANMSLLEKIVYLADYIEPTRDFDGLKNLRRLAYLDLDAAILEGLRMTMAEITERGKVPHANTLSAIEYLKRSNNAQ